MKKLLLTALLFAGTTFAFANNKVESSTSSLKMNKDLTLSKEASSTEKAFEIKNICHTTVFTEHTHVMQETGMDGTVFTYEVATTTFYTYFHGC